VCTNSKFKDIEDRYVMHSLSLLTSSPGARYFGGFRDIPMPLGVPVRITVPGARVVSCERKLTILATSKMRSLVLESCIVSPFTLKESLRLCGSNPLSCSTNAGPRGQNLFHHVFKIKSTKGEIEIEI
jgi:hypothetical protein